MKKLIILLILFVSSFTNVLSQEHRVLYKSIYAEDTGFLDLENVFIYNYGGSDTIKVFASSGDIVYYDKITESSIKETESGLKFKVALYKLQNSEVIIALQIFDNKDYGMRITFSDGDQIQFFE